MNRQQARYREVAQVLARHGLGYLTEILGLARWVPSSRPEAGQEAAAEHLRLALEELGPTAVKLGQILSTRPDLLPSDLQHELAKLQDGAPPVSASAIRRVLTNELGSDPAKVFRSFDFAPLASASIGQAHAAQLLDGTEVVVKVRRPGAVEQVGDDLEIMRNLAMHASRHWEVAARTDVVGLVDDFADTTRAELDYLREGRNAERFAKEFAGDPDVHIPKVYWETSTSRVLTLERLWGIKVSDLEALDSAGIDRPALASRATRIVADMVFENGFFHADLHPGNLFIEPGGTIGLLDFGMVGTVDDRTRKQLVDLLTAFSRSDPERVASALLMIGEAQAEVDRQALVYDVSALLRRYQGRSLGDIPVGAFVNEVLTILRKHRIVLPRQLALLIKMLVMVEGMGALLDPTFRIGDVLTPYLQRFMARQAPAAFAQRIGQAGLDAAQLSLELPAHLRRLLDLLDSGGIEVHLRAKELEPLVTRTERVGKRLVAGILAAALIEAAVDLITARARRR